MRTYIEIAIPVKLLGYNQLTKPLVFMTRGRNVYKAQIGELKEKCLLEMMNDGQLDDLCAMAKCGTITLNSTYYKTGRAYDDDNAMLGINKLFIDPLVKKGILQDDTVSKLKQSSPVGIRVINKSEERVILKFTLLRGGEETL